MIHFGMEKVTEKLDYLAVVSFLKAFKEFATKDKIEVAQRGNYLNTLAKLGINSQHAKEIILGLTPTNYDKGIGLGERDSEELCEFGTYVEESEIYIKLLINRRQEKAFCFSFHIAEREIAYPFAEDVG